MRDTSGSTGVGWGESTILSSTCSGGSSGKCISSWAAAYLLFSAIAACLWLRETNKHRNKEDCVERYLAAAALSVSPSPGPPAALAGQRRTGDTFSHLAPRDTRDHCTHQWHLPGRGLTLTSGTQHRPHHML